MLTIHLIYSCLKCTLKLQSELFSCRYFFSLFKVEYFISLAGRPPPVVRWLVNGKYSLHFLVFTIKNPILLGLIVDEQVEQTTGDLTENRLMWPSVQRSDLNSIFTCQAINTPLVEPRESSYVLDLHCELVTLDLFFSISFIGLCFGFKLRFLAGFYTLIKCMKMT